MNASSPPAEAAIPKIGNGALVLTGCSQLIAADAIKSDESSGAGGVEIMFRMKDTKLLVMGDSTLLLRKILCE